MLLRVKSAFETLDFIVYCLQKARHLERVLARVALVYVSAGWSNPLLFCFRASSSLTTKKGASSSFEYLVQWLRHRDMLQDMQLVMVLPELFLTATLKWLFSIVEDS